jgi:hypothetical protein
MKTLSEIFEKNPSLLETKEVKELISQFKIQFDSIKKSKMSFWDKVTTLTMNSELFVIKGMPCRKVIEKINDLAFSDEML